MVAKLVDDIWNELEIYTLSNDYLLVTDKNIYKFYGEEINRLVNSKDNIYVMEAGEESKSLDVLTEIYNRMIDKTISRKGLIISLGGGVVGDLSGFAAATYKRGIAYIQVPTSLLSQVDSSIGGKTGINFHGLKNIIGSFHFPRITLIDSSFLKTLPTKEILSGLGEILKYGLIYDYDFYKYIIENKDKILNRDLRVLNSVIKKSIEIKSNIYQEDKYDLGIRQTLNFGHTIGHGIESLYDYKIYSHGEAVILGMIYESTIAREKGLISFEYYNEIISGLSGVVEPVIFDEDMINELIDHMKNDKKNEGGEITFCLPTGLGKVDIFKDIDKDMIKRVLLSKDILEIFRGER